MSKLVCPYCERSYHRLKRHLMTAHNMSEEEVYSLGIPLISEESSTKSSNNTKSQWSDPVKSKSIREAVAVSSSLSMKRYLTDPKYAESRSLKSTKSNNTRWANPDDSFHSPEVRSKVIEGARKGRILFWNDPDKSESRRIRSKKLSISRKALFMDPNHYLNSDQIRLNQSEAAKRVWSDPDRKSVV